MKKLVMTALVAVALMVAALPAATIAKDEGKSDCQSGGWQDLVTADGAPFANQGACVSYVARGGVFGVADLTLSPGTYEGGTTDPKVYHFMWVTGTGETTKSFTVTNEGAGASNTLTVVGPRGVCCIETFDLVEDTCSGRALAASEWCTLEIGLSNPAQCHAATQSGLPMHFDVIGDPVGDYVRLDITCVT